jgi:hypothetical protein
MKHEELIWFLGKAILAEDFIVGNEDRAKYLALLAELEKAPKKKAPPKKKVSIE